MKLSMYSYYFWLFFLVCFVFFFFKQKTAYEIYQCDWSSDVCSSDLVKRPRGYSCEEIGGLAFSTETGFPEIERLSINLPLFVSPHGTGSSRYVKTLIAEEGIYAVWQQSQDDFSQPLVLNFLSNSEIEKILQ